MQSKEKFADKISKLLLKAESTTTAEAESLVAKAQELMTRYAIDEAMVDAARGIEAVQKVVEEVITYTGIFHAAAWNIGAALCGPNECRHLIRKLDRASDLFVIGFEGDVARVKMLDASVQIQARGALLRWSREQDRTWMSGMQWFKARRGFLFGFADGLTDQLATVHDRVVAEAQKEESSVALVLRDKKQRVGDWIDEKYGKLHSSSRRYSGGGADAHAAGRSAGQRADIAGRGRVPGRTRELTA